MASDVLKGNWKQLKGKAQEKWGELTDDEIDQVKGEKTQLVGLLQEKYGYSKQRAEEEIDDFMEENR
jgi:uncharacterized protein YjbJ (UPF0337 family)